MTVTKTERSDEHDARIYAYALSVLIPLYREGDNILVPVTCREFLKFGACNVKDTTDSCSGFLVFLLNLYFNV